MVRSSLWRKPESRKRLCGASCIFRPMPAPRHKAAAEAGLRGLGPSIFGVLLADKAIFRVLEKLQIPVSAMAGHERPVSSAALCSLAAPCHRRNEHGSTPAGNHGMAIDTEALATARPDVASPGEVVATKLTIVEVADAVAGAR